MTIPWSSHLILASATGWNVKLLLTPRAGTWPSALLLLTSGQPGPKHIDFQHMSFRSMTYSALKQCFNAMHQVFKHATTQVQVQVAGDLMIKMYLQANSNNILLCEHIQKLWVWTILLFWQELIRRRPCGALLSYRVCIYSMIIQYKWVFDGANCQTLLQTAPIAQLRIQH